MLEPHFILILIAATEARYEYTKQTVSWNVDWILDFPVRYKREKGQTTEVGEIGLVAIVRAVRNVVPAKISIAPASGTATD